MNSLRSNWTRFRRLFRKAQLDRDLDDELAAHLDLHIADNLRSGLSPAEARRQALLRLGGLQQTKENYRDGRGFPFFESIVRDLRFAVRTLRKNPVFSIVAILTLTLGIGANTAIFSVVDSVMLRSLPFAHPSEIVDISGHSTSFDIPFLNLSLPDVSDLRDASSSFTSLAVYQDSPKELTGSGLPGRIESTEVSHEFFTTLGLTPILGRTFDIDDMQPRARVAVLSYPLWRERFGGASDILGQTITLDGQPHRIIGVMPALSPLGFATDSKIWTAYVPTEEERTDREGYSVAVLGRLKTGVTASNAQHELDIIAARLSAAYPEAHQAWSFQVTPLTQFLLGDARIPLTILSCAVGLVLLIACANVSNIFLSRNSARTREFAIRSALGAPRNAIFRQLVVECLVVGLTGGACALFMSSWTIHGLRAILPPEIPRVEDIRINAHVAYFTFGISLLAAVLSGMAPAVMSTRGSLNASIKGTGLTFGDARSGHSFFRPLLLVTEVALSVVLLLGAVLAVRSFNHLLRLNLGFQPDHLLTLKMDFPKFRFASSTQSISFVQQVLDGTRAISGVSSASAALVFPMADEIADTLFETEATANDAKLGEQAASANRVAPHYFQTLGIPLLAGREFTDADNNQQSLVFIVNETLARKYFGTVNAVGKRLSARKENGRPVWGQIIGVVGDVHQTNLREGSKPQVYAAFYESRIATGVYLVIRTKIEPRSMLSAIQDRIWAVDKYQPVTRVTTLTERLSEINAAPRTQAQLLGVFALLGLVLALVGLYGVISYLVSLQTHEIGIRIALGASPTQILRSVLARGTVFILTGVVIGIAVGIVLTQFMSSVLFGINPTDPLTFASVASILFVAALLACYIPARRATKVDPITTLRYE